LTIRITEKENKRLFNGQYKKGINYGNAYTGNYVASKIYSLPEYAAQLKRITIANGVVFVGGGVIPIYEGEAAR
jgi:hypothetical protein